MRLLILLLSLLAPVAPAVAQAPADVVRLELLPGWRQADGTHVAGLRIRLAPGWKTYWRAPGEAGIPPRFDWSGSHNLAGADAHFPVPHVFHTNGMRTIGYDDAVLLPLRLRTRDADAPIRLEGQIELGVCETICIPVTAQIDAVLPATGAAPGGAAEIRAALTDAPLSGHEAGVSAVACRIEPIADGLRLTATLTMPALGREETAVIEAPDAEIWVSEVAAERRGDTLVASADLVPPHGGPFALDRSALRITVLAGGRAVEMQGCAAG